MRAVSRWARAPPRSAPRSCARPRPGTSQAHRDALADRRADRPHARLQRPARPRHPQPLHGRAPDAPLAYPEIHYATAPVRAAARKAGDADLINLWAGEAHALAEALPAAEIVAQAQRVSSPASITNSVPVM